MNRGMQAAAWCTAGVAVALGVVALWQQETARTTYPGKDYEALVGVRWEFIERLGEYDVFTVHSLDEGIAWYMLRHTSDPDVWVRLPLANPHDGIDVSNLYSLIPIPQGGFITTARALTASREAGDMIADTDGDGSFDLMVDSNKRILRYQEGNWMPQEKSD